ncbi:MAG: hypothetical protein LC640_04735, partial [Frankia sp.]|nr:hypothetical protein [Frankia sp.]
MSGRGWETWRAATQRALYGPDGFYRRGRGPGRDYRTSTTATGSFSVALATLVDLLDTALGAPPTLHVAEVGAARGWLTRTLSAELAVRSPELAARVEWWCVDLGAPPADLPAHINWRHTLDELPPLVGLLLANEWLDNVPVDVVERT